tara:strand:+ start:1419 stop:1832 length:414 start_codon:yes stop_codon:yes gene_type:complete
VTPIVLALITLGCGGVIRFFSKVAGANDGYGPTYMLAQCIGFAFVAAMIHVIERQHLDLSLRMTGIAIVGGMIGAVGVFALILGFKMGGEGSILFPISGMSVVVAVVFSILVYREPITASKIVGLALGIGSIVILSR